MADEFPFEPCSMPDDFDERIVRLIRDSDAAVLMDRLISPIERETLEAMRRDLFGTSFDVVQETLRCALAEGRGLPFNDVEVIH